ncbi:MAG: hypothetical protein KJ726_10125 [Verrucomicrobia bacterium]|nr:hypothetical protein [Verrucomicrobiota bacterium]MBU1910392.1 hypothetical protein [Verrucomicrobiota bacterium]
MKIQQDRNSICGAAIFTRAQVRKAIAGIVLAVFAGACHPTVTMAFDRPDTYLCYPEQVRLAYAVPYKHPGNPALDKTMIWAHSVNTVVGRGAAVLNVHYRRPTDPADVYRVQSMSRLAEYDDHVLWYAEIPGTGNQFFLNAGVWGLDWHLASDPYDYRLPDYAVGGDTGVVGYNISLCSAQTVGHSSTKRRYTITGVLYTTQPPAWGKGAVSVGVVAQASTFSGAFPMPWMGEVLDEANPLTWLNAEYAGTLDVVSAGVLDASNIHVWKFYGYVPYVTAPGSVTTLKVLPFMRLSTASPALCFGRNQWDPFVTRTSPCDVLAYRPGPAVKSWRWDNNFLWDEYTKTLEPAEAKHFLWYRLPVRPLPSEVIY